VLYFFVRVQCLRGFILGFFMNVISKIVISFCLLFSAEETYCFATAKMLKSALHRSFAARPVVGMGAQHGRTLAEYGQKLSDYKASLVQTCADTKDLYRLMRIGMKRNPGKTLVGGMFAGFVISGNYFVNVQNPYEQKLKENLLLAAEQDNVDLVNALNAIDSDEETIKQAILKHALTNRKEIEERIKQAVKFDGKDQKAFMMHETQLKQINDAAVFNNINTFKALLEKLEDPYVVVENVIKGGDLHKVIVLLKEKIPAKNMLRLAIKEKNVEITHALLMLEESNLSKEESLMKAKFLCDRTLFQRIFFGNRFGDFKLPFKLPWNNTPVEKDDKLAAGNSEQTLKTV